MNQEEQNMGHDSDNFFDDVEGDLPVAVEAAGGNAEVVEGDAPVPARKVPLEGIHVGFFCCR